MVERRLSRSAGRGGKVWWDVHGLGWEMAHPGMRGWEGGDGAQGGDEGRAPGTVMAHGKGGRRSHGYGLRAQNGRWKEAGVKRRGGED